MQWMNEIGYHKDDAQIEKQWDGNRYVRMHELDRTLVKKNEYDRSRRIARCGYEYTIKFVAETEITMIRTGIR
jgi:hypothetical protein